ncbi:hypothetical protein [Roseivirga misakiensis]|uniref:DUF998 domain-containing protein n=1 Tax=Roseivirga misakiensis TaxID=1563681 RepID=A0A1E5SYS0_9BACT|nr:hypothetical protein [Roseivirga misakiensis]OEK04252.1 hypothetical protein BFP71_12270 [Roseivirga misakiensis]
MSSTNPNIGTNTNLSYYRIRKWIGTFGALLPILLPIVSNSNLPSISHYYYSVAGIIFTSLLMLIGVFLLSYKGYDWLDNAITSIGGVAIAFVAIFPTPFEAGVPGLKTTPILVLESDMLFGFLPIGGIHFGSAVIFFICMAIMSIRQFTQGDLTAPGKKLRNLIYSACGYGILATLVFAGVTLKFFPEKAGVRFVFWVEVVMLILFAGAWLLKGEALKDLKNLKEELKL